MRSTRVDVLACRELLLFGVALAMKSAPGLSTRIDWTMDRESDSPRAEERFPQFSSTDRTHSQSPKSQPRTEHTREPDSQSVSYFTVPARAHPTGSQSGSATRANRNPTHNELKHSDTQNSNSRTHPRQTSRSPERVNGNTITSLINQGASQAPHCVGT